MRNSTVKKKETNGTISILDLSTLPHKNHQGRSVVDWRKVNNNDVVVTVNNTSYTVGVTYSYTKDSIHFLTLHYKDNFKLLSMKDFKRLRFKKLINECNTNINDNISDECIAVRRPDLIKMFNNTDDAYTHTIGSSKEVYIKCPNCSTTRLYKIQYLTREGRSYKCPICSRGTSYGEKLFYVINSLLNLGFSHKAVLEDLKHREFDFFNKDLGIAVEINGIQHYEEGTGSFHNAYKRTVESDREKREYCNLNNIQLIEIDARFSDFNFIIDNINKSKLDIAISSNMYEEILIEVDKYSTYDVEAIINRYRETGSMERTGEEYQISPYTVKRLLSKFDIRLIKHTTKIKCITTGETFNSQRQACKEYGIQPSNLNKALKGVRVYAGTHKITGEKLQWEYVE